jgi:gas vesicle protein
MVFDLISFFAGIAAGGLTGALAGVLYGLERTADLQERLLKLRKKIDRIDPRASSPNGSRSSDVNMGELRKDLDSIQEEIRKMYRRTAG